MLSRPERFGRGPSTTGTQSQTANLTEQSVQAIESPEQAPDVESVSPVITTSETATFAAASYSTTVIGTSPAYLGAEDYTLEAGSPITASDVTNRRRVALVGQTVLSNLFAAEQGIRSVQSDSARLGELRDHRRARREEHRLRRRTNQWGQCRDRALHRWCRTS